MTLRARSLVGPLAAAAAAVVLLAGCAGGEPDPTRTPEPVATTAAAVTEEPSETPEVTETPEATPTEEAESLADTVWAQVLENFGGQVSSGSPLFAVTEVEDVSTGTIRVYVQENLTDADRDEIAQHTINMGAIDNDELQTVVVRDASGVDSNHYR